MFENKTIENIVEEMKKRILTEDSTIDTREGSLIHTAISPVAFELMQAYMDMNYTFKNTNPKTADKEFLIEMAKNRGIELQPPQPAYFIVSPTLTPEQFNNGVTGVTNNGEKLIFDDLNKCHTVNTGTQMNDLIHTPYVTLTDGKSTNLQEIYLHGTDEEDIESLRKRYFNTYRGKSFAGNKIAYQEKILENPKVGLVSVEFRKIYSDNVIIHILNRDLEPADTDLCNEVRDMLDPKRDGQGNGWCPIGHKPSVSTFNVMYFDITYEVKLSVGATITNIEKQIKERIDKYLKEFVYNYFNSSPNPNSYVVSTDRLESLILDISKDILSVTVWDTNTKKTNTTIPMTTSQIPKLRNLVVHTDGDGLEYAY